MEGLIKRAVIVAGVSGVLALTFNLLTKNSGSSKTLTEAQIEDLAPMTVSGQAFQPLAGNPKQSVKTDQSVYDLWQPWGVVERVYDAKPGPVDTVLIVSDSKDTVSLHTPLICFPAQGWTVAAETNEVLKTKQVGDVPVSIAQMVQPQSGEKLFVIWTYKFGSTYASTPRAMTLGLLLPALKAKVTNGLVFYRFLPMDKATTKEQLMQFAADYLDTASSTSKGFL